MNSFFPSSILILVLLLVLLPTSHAATFPCSSPSKPTCQSLIGYVPPNSTTLSSIKSLFQIKSLRPLLSFNDLPLSTPPSHVIPSGSVTRIRFTCRCLNGSGSASRKPVYRVKPGDGLDSIARTVFNGFVTDQEIAAANNISNPNLIKVGQEILIPLPCSCDDVEGRHVVHYGHVVVQGSSVAGIGSEFGVDPEVLMRVNGLKDPKELLAGQILDVPLRACSTSISNTSIDHNLLVPNGSSVLTANNCVLCSCSSSSWQLDCSTTKGLNSGTCLAAMCGHLYLGNISSSSACDRSVCSYAGYNKTSILTNLTTQSFCNSSEAPILQPTGAATRGLEIFPFLPLALILASVL